MLVEDSVDGCAKVRGWVIPFTALKAGTGMTPSIGAFDWLWTLHSTLDHDDRRIAETVAHNH
jgi:hypothetical protein